MKIKQLSQFYRSVRPLRRSILLVSIFLTVLFAAVFVLTLVSPATSLYLDSIVANEGIILGELNSDDIVRIAFDVQHQQAVDLTLNVATYGKEIASGGMKYELLRDGELTKNGVFEYTDLIDNGYLRIDLTDIDVYTSSKMEMILTLYNLSSPITFWSGISSDEQNYVETSINGQRQDVSPSLNLKFQDDSYEYSWDLLVVFIFLMMVTSFQLFEAYDSLGALNEEVA